MTGYRDECSGPLCPQAQAHHHVRAQYSWKPRPATPKAAIRCLLVSAEFLRAGENILIIDDFLASWQNAAGSLAHCQQRPSPCRSASAWSIEKAFEGGRAAMSWPNTTCRCMPWPPSPAWTATAIIHARINAAQLSQHDGAVRQTGRFLRGQGKTQHFAALVRPVKRGASPVQTRRRSSAASS